MERRPIIRCFCHFEDRSVGSDWNLYSYCLVRGSSPHVMLCQPLAKFSSSGAHHRIISCVIVRGATKHVRSDHALSEHLLTMCLGVFDDVTEERLTLSAGSEDRPSQHIFKCLFYLR